MKQKNRDGLLTDKADMQDRILAALYGNMFGRMFLKPLVTPAFSKLAGFLLSTRASCLLIRPFIRKFHIDTAPFEATKYRSYNEFFSRKILPEYRPVDADPQHLISPCDSKLTVLPIMADARFTLKHTDYTISSLLRNKALSDAYAGGLALFFRLSVDDYHRYCYVADGHKENNIRIPGVFHTVNPIANDHYPIYKENTREYSVLHSDVFGDIVMMEVGALMVGKIVNHHKQAFVQRGQEKGYFQFGGSTVVLLLKANTAEIDEDIRINSENGIETVVKYGERIGQALL